MDQHGVNKDHFCTIRTVQDVSGNTKAALLNEAKWTVSRLTVGFLEGDPQLRQRVIDVARGQRSHRHCLAGRAGDGNRRAWRWERRRAWRRPTSCRSTSCRRR